MINFLVKFFMARLVLAAFSLMSLVPSWALAMERNDDPLQERLGQQQRQLEEKGHQLTSDRQAIEQQQRNIEQQQQQYNERESQLTFDLHTFAQQQQAFDVAQQNLNQDCASLDELLHNIERQQQTLDEQRRQQEMAVSSPPAPPVLAIRHPVISPSFSAAGCECLAAPHASAAGTVEHPIPSIAMGHEAIYRKFIQGSLVYRGPAGERSFAFTDFANPLEGEFNLSGLTFEDTWGKDKNIKPVDQYLRIKLGYRTIKENDNKVTCWIVPKFVINQAANCAFIRDYKNKLVSWTSDIGVFWSYGGDDLNDFDWLTTKSFDEISTQNLYDLAYTVWCMGGVGWNCGGHVFSFVFN